MSGLLGFTDGIQGWLSLTGRAVVANSEGDCDGRVNVTKTVAGHGSATNVGGTLPHNLGEVAPSIEVVHAGVSLAIQGLEVAHLVVVHQVGDHLSNLFRGDTISNVLAIPTAINGARETVSTFNT